MHQEVSLSYQHGHIIFADMCVYIHKIRILQPFDLKMARTDKFICNTYPDHDSTSEDLLVFA